MSNPKALVTAELPRQDPMVVCSPGKGRGQAGKGPAAQCSLLNSVL